MAAPVAAKITLPVDTGNTGPKVRTQTRVVGADTVHEHFMVVAHPRSILGRYFVSSGILTATTAAQNGTSTGMFWLVNPAGSSIRVAVLSSECAIVAGASSAAQTTLTRLVLALFTATGTPSGAQVGYAKRDSTDATPVSSLRTAVTGLTVTVGNVIRGFLYPTITGTTGVGIASPVIWPERDQTAEEHAILRAGEGVLCYQPDTSTLATIRSLVNLMLEEFET